MNPALINELRLFGARMARDGAAYAAGHLVRSPIDRMEENPHYISIINMLKENENATA